MSKLHNDLINEVDSWNTVHESVAALCNGIADRIEASRGNAVKLSDLCSILREDPDALADAVLNRTFEAQAAGTRTRDRSTPDAPAAVWEKPREDVRPGMVDTQSDHRDQVFPPNANTEPERERIRQEQIARDRGATVTVNQDMPDTGSLDQRERANREAEAERRREEGYIPA